MPGNEVGDRVHNFFAQDLSQSQHNSQGVEGSWPVVENNPWAASQRHIGLPNPNLKNYNIQQSDIERGHSNHSFPVPHGLNFSQSGPESGKHPFQSQQQNLNGYMHGRQILQTRQNEAKFLGVDTESDHCNMISRGLSTYESQQANGPENHHLTSVRSDSSESPVSFDFFGSQTQISGQQTGMLQSLQRQQSGFGDMQLLQQQAMFRKMQELQRQQQIQQLEARQQNSMTQIPSLIKQTSDSHSPGLINGTPIFPTDASNYPWASEPTAGNSNWMQRVTPAIQGCSNGFKISADQGQALSLPGLIQQVDQSLCGVPISTARSAPLQYSHVPVDKPPVQQMTMYGNSFQGNQYTGFPDQVNMQDGALVSRPGFQGENTFAHASGQGLRGGMPLENLQQVNDLQRDECLQELHERQELAGSSESLKERSSLQVSSSQNVVALDPTEEKILFGDDNIWDAFGSSANLAAGGFNALNSTGLLNGFPSVQSGSWSALMQSAVAETSSNDAGIQGEWAGLSLQNAEVLSRQCQSPSYENNTKQQTVLADNKLPIASTSSSVSVSLSESANPSSSYPGLPAFSQPRQNSHEHGERLLRDFTCRSIQHSSEEGSKWLSHGPLEKPHGEGNQISRNPAHYSDSEPNIRSISGSWPPEQCVSSCYPSHPQNKSNGHDVGEPMSPSVDAKLKTKGSENKLVNLQSNYHKKVTYEEMRPGAHVQTVDSGSNSTVGLQRANSSIGSPQVNREECGFNAVAVKSNSNIAGASQDISQLLPSGHRLNYWKHVGSSIKSAENENSGKLEYPMTKNPQVLESSMSNSDKDAVKVHELRNHDRKENSTDSHHSNSYQRNPSSLRENIWLDGSDSRTLPGSKLRSSGQVGQKTSAPRKFQYHPMGNLDEDEETSHGVKHAVNSKVTCQQIPRASYSQNQGYFGQSNFFGQFSKASTEKGHSSDLLVNRKGEDEVPSRSALPDFGPNASDPFERSGGMYPPDKATQSSQNMLELLQKVDQSGGHGNSDGCIGLPNQPSASQGFGLQLALPSQRMPVKNSALASQNSMQTDNYTMLASTSQVQTLPTSNETSQGELKINKVGIPGQHANEVSKYGVPGNLSSPLASGFPLSMSQLQNQQVLGVSGKVPVNQLKKVSFDQNASHYQRTGDSTTRVLSGQATLGSLPDTARFIPHDKPVSSGDNTSQAADFNNSYERASTSQNSAGQAVSPPHTLMASRISQQVAFPKMVSNDWGNVPAQQHILDTQPYNFSSSTSHSNQLHNIRSTSITTQCQEDQDVKKGDSPSEFGANHKDQQNLFCRGGQLTTGSLSHLVSSGNSNFATKMSVFQRKESGFRNPSEPSSSDSVSTQRDIEAFGRSLKPNKLLHDNYSLLHQMQAMKNVEIDPSNRGLRGLEEADSDHGSQITGHLAEHDALVRDSPVHHVEVPSGDTKMLSSLGLEDKQEKDASSQPGNVSSQDALILGPCDPENQSRINNMTPFRAEHSQTSPNMAPSWFNQFGTFKNGQIFQMYDVPKSTFVRAGEQPFTLGKSSGSLHALNAMEQVNPTAVSGKVANIWQGPIPTSVAMGDISSSHSLAQEITDQHLVVARPKKRKGATSDLVPWHKEVMQGSRSLVTIRMAEVDWARAANQLIDKMEDEAEMTEDVPPRLRSKRRLVFTTQLMQQLFRPPPATVLSSDASSNYDTVAHVVARLAVVDACSVIPCSGSSSFEPQGSTNLSSDMQQRPDGVGDQYLSKVMEDFIGRARKLENDFMRLDKRVSVIDLKTECQDIEKYSVINRFAKFHGRGQGDGAETSSSFMAVNAQRPSLQRYVTALPLPRNLPDRVQCLSL
ncbi:hypothetical protein NMG60_11009674 [Bertholletia excelsa]